MAETAARPLPKKKWVAAGVIGLAVLLFASVALAPVGTNASSHREAPLVSADPQVDATDLYAFNSPDAPGTVTFVSSWIPFEEPAGGPNFYHWADGVRYDVLVDNNGDAKPDITYRWVFDTVTRPSAIEGAEANFLYNDGQVTSLTDDNLLVRQTYDLTRIKGGQKTTLLNDAPVAPSYVGRASMPNYEADLFVPAVQTATGSVASWVGQSDDPFFLDLRVFDLLYGANLQSVGDDTLKGFNVNTMALRVPATELAAGGNLETNPIIGVWTTASRPTTRIQNRKTGAVKYEGKYVQVSRLGMPLVNEVVVPLALKDYFNASKPTADAQYLTAVQDPAAPRIVNAVYNIPIPDSDPDTAGIQRKDLIEVFLTGLLGLNQPTGVKPAEMLRLNMTTPQCTKSDCSRLGAVGGDVAGFPNGRRLSDDILDIALRVVEGVLLPGHHPVADTIGDGVDTNDVPFRSSFPYVAVPFGGSNAAPH